MTPGGNGCSYGEDDLSQRVMRKSRPSERSWNRRELSHFHRAGMISSGRKAQNRLSGSPDSSDDNTNKILNMKESWYDKNISSEDVRSIKSLDNIKNYRKQGAIPKGYYNYNRGTDSGDSWKSSIKYGSKNREKCRNFNNQDSQSVNSLNLDTRRPGKTVKRGKQKNTSMPFYYSVPEDPAKADVLPAGRYLVVPLNCIQTCLEDAFSQSTKKQEGKGRGENSQPANPNRCSKMKDEQKGNSETVVNKSEENSEKDKEINTSTMNLDALSSEVDNIFTLFQENEPSSVSERQLEIEEVLNRILDALPHININDEKEELEALKTESDINDYISRVRIKDIADIKREFPNLLDREVVQLYDLYKGRSPNFSFEAQKMQDNRKKEEHKNSQIAFMCSTIPDADPQFMIQKYEELNGNEDEISRFLDSLIDTQFYPKVKEELVAKKEKWWKCYVSNFSIEEFLDKVSNLTIFTSDRPDRRNLSPTNAEMEFLKGRYPNMRNLVLSSTFTKYNCSLTKTCQYLDNVTESLNTVDRTLLQFDFEEDFLKEVSYILHAEEIHRYLTEKEDRKLAEREWAKEENTFFECIACFDDKVIPSDVLTCPEGHVTCKPCLTRYLEVHYADGNYKFSCIDMDCTSEYTTSTIQRAVKETIFLKIMAGKAADEVARAAIPGLETCPACDYAYIPDPANKIFQCENESCRQQTCRLCREPSHIPLSCREVQRPKDVDARKKIEEVMTNKLLRDCPSCRKKFVKIDGCNKINCVCGTILCYICGSIIRGYDHFASENPYQKGTILGKCPLFSNNKELHDNAVLQAGIMEKDKILKEDPDIRLDHDPTRTATQKWPK